jgi:hypothetical protein
MLNPDLIVEAERKIEDFVIEPASTMWRGEWKWWRMAYELQEARCNIRSGKNVQLGHAAS